MTTPKAPARTLLELPVLAVATLLVRFAACSITSAKKRESQPPGRHIPWPLDKALPSDQLLRLSPAAPRAWQIGPVILRWATPLR